ADTTSRAAARFWLATIRSPTRTRSGKDGGTEPHSTITRRSSDAVPVDDLHPGGSLAVDVQGGTGAGHRSVQRLYTGARGRRRARRQQPARGAALRGVDPGRERQPESPRRSVCGNEGAGRRLLPDRRAGSGGGAVVGGALPRREPRSRRGQAALERGELTRRDGAAGTRRSRRGRGVRAPNRLALLGLAEQQREAVGSIPHLGVADLERQRVVRAIVEVAEVDEHEARVLHLLDHAHGVDPPAVLAAVGLVVSPRVIDDPVQAA